MKDLNAITAPATLDGRHWHSLPLSLSLKHASHIALSVRRVEKRRGKQRFYKKWSETRHPSQAYSSHFHFFCSLDWEKIISQLHITLIRAEQREKKAAKKVTFTLDSLFMQWGSMKNVLPCIASCGHFFSSLSLLPLEAAQRFLIQRLWRKKKSIIALLLRPAHWMTFKLIIEEKNDTRLILVQRTRTSDYQ